MEAYPEGSLTHNHPFIVLSGLASESTASGYDASSSQSPLFDEDGPRITSKFPPITTETADQLRSCFLQEAARGSGHNDRVERMNASSVGFNLKIAGRTFRLPTRKANIEKVSQWISPDPSSPTSSQSLVLHSPISPLSPSSPLFPDGVMTPLWITKHQDLLPSAFISFYNLTADPDISSHDNELKEDILKVKQSLASSSSRSRYIVVLLSEASVLDISDLDDRLANIRRGAGLDPKSLFLLPPQTSLAELRDFARTILSAIQPLCIEYYRDLSKHARRKRNRGAVPQPTVPPFRGTSQTLSGQGWNVRYDFKLGILAEFRQEMDAATRHYEGAYDMLLSQDVFESIASWSPRWNEARLLADIISVRVLRCLLWNNQTTSAVRRWQLHRAGVKDIVDRRGKGSANYGWEAWEAKWAKVMADLLQELALPHGGDAIYANPEKAIPVGERLSPWQHLHHAGYWFSLMTRHLYARQRFAEMIPEEDRTSPGQSPASQVANKAYLYDTYLCPEPHQEAPLHGREGVSHFQLIVDGLNMSLQVFEARGQKRVVERLKFEIAKEQMRHGLWTDAIQNLRSLWQNMSWRREGWWSVVQEVCWALRTCARQVGDADTIVSIEWELLNDLFPPRPDGRYDLANCLEGLQSVKSKPKVIFKAGDVVSFLSASHAFGSAEENVGDYLTSQLVISSRAHKRSSPVTLADIRLVYDGGFKPITLRHKAGLDDSDTTGNNSIQYMKVQLEEMSSLQSHQASVSPVTNRGPLFIGDVDLTLIPGQTKVFELAYLLREVGEIRAKSATLSMIEESFEVEYVVPIDDRGFSSIWWNKTAEGLKKQKIVREAVNVLKVLPKPPKMQLSVHGMQPQYYAGERISVDVEILNKEEEETEASLEVRILGDFDETPKLVWMERSDRALVVEGDAAQEPNLPGHRIGKLDPRVTAREEFSFYSWSQPMDYILEVKVLYHLMTDPDTPISRTLTETLSAICPFGASYEFSPRVHPAPWPKHSQSQDEMTSTEDQLSNEKGQGITQRWCIAANVACLAAEKLDVEKVELEVITINDEITCSIVQDDDENSSSSLASTDEARELQFTLDVQRPTLEDRRPASLDLALNIKWKRPEPPDSETFSTRIPAPRLLVPGGEPRVLASVQYSSSVPGLIHLSYTIENRSMHQLTFSLVMESSEDFAFHGPKFGSLQLVPISRHTVRFNLFPTVQGTWIQPQLRVVDRGFNKTLRVVATEGVKTDKKGILIWVNADD
ncbi:MAG: hypothetical protein M1816_005307 [Peltula sp. TS41687]|nr:MAG: hypothetical protein M1816_005307 [Peltula sp. TS41687]